MMTFSLLRPALAVGVALTLAACGGSSGKATFPVKVEVYGLQYEGLVLNTNGMDLAVMPNATYDASIPAVATFPKELEYGVVYDVLPKGATDANITGGTQPKHQTCTPGYQGHPRTSTTGLLASIDVWIQCSINSYPIGGTIKGLTGTGLVLINGSAGGSFSATPVIDATTKLPTDVPFGYPSLAAVQYGKTYGLSVLTQPTGQTCTVSGGGNGQGAGTMDDKAEASLDANGIHNGVSDLLVTCTANP
jgi:hypothetical protein